VALPREVVRPPGRQGRLLLADRPVEAGRLVRVGVVAACVDVDRLAGDQHRRGGVAGERDDELGVGGREADAVDEQVGAAAVGGFERVPVVAVGGDEAASGRGDVGGQAGGVAA